MTETMQLVCSFLCFATVVLRLMSIFSEAIELDNLQFSQSRLRKRKRDRNAAPKYLILDKISKRLLFIERITQDSNRECFKNLRMSRPAFEELCRLLRGRCGLTDDRYVSVNEKVAIFLRTLAHHQKNRVLQSDFQQSGHIISQVFHQVLKGVLKMHAILLAKPIPVGESNTDKRWKWFQGCVGALDVTYIPLHIPTSKQPRFRTRKGGLETNVLAVCNIQGRFTYVLRGWEGSAADSRVLRDAIDRDSGFRVQSGTYYLCDSGYTNGPSFLTPYRGTHYHLQEWATANRRPHNHKELFNLRHSAARNVIERAFGILKKHFAVLRSTTFFLVRTQCDIILVCALLHNFVMNASLSDPLLDPRTQHELSQNATLGTDDDAEHIQSVNPTPAWSEFRNNLALEH